jgi:hypothetical protein
MVRIACGAQHFRDERCLVAGQREACGQYCRQLDADVRQRVVGEHHLQDQRRAAEDHRVAARKGREQRQPAQLHRCQDQAEDQPAEQPERRDLQGQLDALQQIRHAEIVQEQGHRSIHAMRD